MLINFCNFSIYFVISSALLRKEIKQHQTIAQTKYIE